MFGELLQTNEYNEKRAPTKVPSFVVLKQNNATKVLTNALECDII